MNRFSLFLFSCFLLAAQYSCAQPLSQKTSFTRQDSLRGTLNANRTWWDVTRYDIEVTPDFNTKTLSGSTAFSFKVTTANPGGMMQLDLQEPMIIDSIIQKSSAGGNHTSSAAPRSFSFKRDGNAWLVATGNAFKDSGQLVVYFHGKPREAINPPWDGGWIWKRDAQGRPWMSVAVQGLGASAWYPCKDHQSDEPERGASITIHVVDTLVAVANGHLKSQSRQNGTAAYTWEVANPINNYNIVPYIGKYVNWSETYAGEKGPLDCSYWVLDYNLDKAKKQFEQTKLMLKAFEYWFGPYPFYEDGFKLVESPHLGMEHQSAVAYGNKFGNGYLGRDLSGSGWGLKWDFIIIHEAGHEWFANNITTKDIADMWVHEGFTSYSEALFTEYYYGKEAANAYVQGIRKNIKNDIPIIGPYGVNQEGSGDMYYKGSNMIHTIRQVINDDDKFRQILRGLNSTFYHQTVTTQQVEDYITQQSGKDLKKVFDQYLRNTSIPVLELAYDKGALKYRWNNCIEGFNMPVKLTNGQWLQPTTRWYQTKLEKTAFDKINADPNFYITVKK